MKEKKDCGIKNKYKQKPPSIHPSPYLPHAPSLVYLHWVLVLRRSGGGGHVRLVLPGVRPYLINLRRRIIRYLQRKLNNHSVNRSVNRPINNFINPSFDQSINQSLDHSTNSSFYQSVIRWFQASIYSAFDQFIIQWNNYLINHAINI